MKPLEMPTFPIRTTKHSARTFSARSRTTSSSWTTKSDPNPSEATCADLDQHPDRPFGIHRASGWGNSCSTCKNQTGASEGMEETLTLHRLGLMSILKPSFRTTNCIENVNSLLQQLTHNVRRWSNSSQRHRWVATALLDIQPRLRRIKGYRHLHMLRQAIQAELGIKQLAMTG